MSNSLKPYITLIVFSLMMSSCNWFIEGTRQITHRVTLNEVNGDYQQAEISVLTMTFYNADKRVTYKKIPSYLGLGIELRIQNRLDSAMSLRIRNGSRFRDTNFYGQFEFNGKKHIVKLLVEQMSENIQVIGARRSWTFTVGTSDPFDFKDFFAEKRNYTRDMIELLNTFKLFYNSDTVPILSDEVSELDIEGFKRVGIDGNVKVYTHN